LEAAHGGFKNLKSTSDGGIKVLAGYPFRSNRPSILLSISVSGRRSIMLPKDMGSLRPLSPGLALGGGVRDMDGSPDPDCPGGCRFEWEELEELGE
jgi:hypothetical protein